MAIPRVAYYLDDLAVVDVVAPQQINEARIGLPSIGRKLADSRRGVLEPLHEVGGRFSGALAVVRRQNQFCVSVDAEIAVKVANFRTAILHFRCVRLLQ